MLYSADPSGRETGCGAAVCLCHLWYCRILAEMEIESSDHLACWEI